jgi:hypothetical protein
LPPELSPPLLVLELPPLDPPEEEDVDGELDELDPRSTALPVPPPRSPELELPR